MFPLLDIDGWRTKTQRLTEGPRIPYHQVNSLTKEVVARSTYWDLAWKKAYPVGIG